MGANVYKVKEKIVYVHKIEAKSPSHGFKLLQDTGKISKNDSIGACTKYYDSYNSFLDLEVEEFAESRKEILKQGTWEHIRAGKSKETGKDIIYFYGVR